MLRWKRAMKTHHQVNYYIPYLKTLVIKKLIIKQNELKSKIKLKRIGRQNVELRFMYDKRLPCNFFVLEGNLHHALGEIYD